MQAMLHKSVKKYLDKQTADKQTQIRAVINDLEKEPPEGDIIPLVGEPGRFRVTVGNHRLLFRIRGDHILITHLDPRGQVYKKKNKGSKR